MAVALLIFLTLYVPFVNKPVHIDDANFLMLAEGATRDWWRPHSILINWSGITEPAFDILANPPGIAWYLAPVRNAPDWLMHLWMSPWLVLAGWGCWRLGVLFANGAGYLACLYLLTCPVVVISAHALTPDLPVFACMSAGVAGFLSVPRFRWAFAIMAGSAALFRYSGGTVIPLLVLAGWWRNGRRGAVLALLSAVPILLLVLHDMHAYEKVHLLAMFASQHDGEEKSLELAIDNCIAGIAMLGGAGVLPILIWCRASVAGTILGIVVALHVILIDDLRTDQAIPTILAIAAGFAALSLAFTPRVFNPVLSAWALGGAVFFYFVKFAATRYWAAFLPGVGLLAVRNAKHSTRWLATGIVINVVISLGLAIDDQNHAQAHKQAAHYVATFGKGTFSGHWGFLHYLSKEGWTPIERGGQTGSIHAFATFGSAQFPDSEECLELIERIPLTDQWSGPKVYSWYHRAFYHAGGRGQYAPWTFSNEPYDVVSVYRRCDQEANGPHPASSGRPEE
ncbi:MAG: hypothetical protein R3C59_28765 [Planctomycetaceae bacterium]